MGRVASTSLVDGMFISEAVLRPPGSKAGLEATIPPGYRAVAVKVDEFVAVGNWLNPGARVDVLVVMNTNRRDRGSSSRVILRNIEVLAVGQVLDTPSKPGKQVSGRSVTLLVLEADAPKIHLASSKGKIRFALRGGRKSGVSDELDYASASESELLGEESPQAAEPRPIAQPTSPVAMVTPAVNRTWTVELITGQSKSQRFEFAGPRSYRRVHGGTPQAGRPKVGTVRSSRRSSETGSSDQTQADDRSGSLWGKVFDVNRGQRPE